MRYPKSFPELLCLALGVLPACGTDSGEGASAAQDAGDGGDHDGPAPDVVVEDPTCTALEPGDKWPQGACLAGATCAGHWSYVCPDGFVALTYVWECACPAGTWQCGNTNDGSLNFPSCDGHELDAGADAADAAGS